MILFNIINKLKDGDFMASEARLKANRKYMENAYTEIKYRSRNEQHLKGRIILAAEKQGISYAQYIDEAIKARVEADEISIEMGKEKEAELEREKQKGKKKHNENN